MADAATGAISLNAMARMMRPGMALKKMGSMKHHNKTFIVAVDGSKIGYRALRLAIAMRNANSLDKIQVITIKGGDVSPEEVTRECDTIFKTEGVTSSACNLLSTKSIVEVLTKPEGESLDVTIRKFTETAFHPVLVMGAVGRNAEGAAQSAGARPKGQAPMGGIATACKINIPCPVVFVKPVGWDVISKKEALDARARGQVPDDKSIKPAVIVCCVDGTPVATKGVDLGTRPPPAVSYTHLTLPTICSV